VNSSTQMIRIRPLFRLPQSQVLARTCESWSVVSLSSPISISRLPTGRFDTVKKLSISARGEPGTTDGRAKRGLRQFSRSSHGVCYRITGHFLKRFLICRLTADIAIGNSPDLRIRGETPVRLIVTVLRFPVESWVVPVSTPTDMPSVVVVDSAFDNIHVATLLDLVRTAQEAVGVGRAVPASERDRRGGVDQGDTAARRTLAQSLSPVASRHRE
jgi:hypothetical protein